MGSIDQPESKISEYLQALTNSRRLGTQVVFQTTLPENPASWTEASAEWPPEIINALRSLGIRALYRHQARAIDLIRNMQHVIVATPTASGKTLIYNLPVLERFQFPNAKLALVVTLRPVQPSTYRQRKYLSSEQGSI